MTLAKVVRLGCAMLMLVCVVVVPVWSWGCKGHQIVALIAEKHLNSRARAMVMQILAASPISPDLRRFCGDSGLDAFADASTWADDERSIKPDTAGWHFIDIPRGEASQYCPESEGCVTRAIADQLNVLRNTTATPQERADALRYVPTKEDYKPNLHGVWDTDIIEHFSQGQTAQQIADELDGKFKTQISAWPSEPVDLTAWTWQSHDVAENVVYGDLPSKIAVEKPVAVNTSADDDHISTRMLKLNEKIGADYESAAEATAQEQLAKAGARLAAVLNSAWH